MKLLVSTTALAIGLMASPSFAQDAAGSPAADSAPQGLADVVVTAQRRTESLQKAPIAVSAIGGDDLVASGVVSASDLTKKVPALNINGLSGGAIQVTVRGVGSFAGNPQTEAGVAINYDGAYVSRPQAAGGLFYDLQRVEVLKGPQGTLYGRNSTAGAVNIITNKPNFDGFSVDTLLDIGNYDLAHGSVAVNLPLSDKVAVRIAADGVNRDGYLSDGYNDDDHWGARAQLQVNPNDQLSVLVGVDYAKFGGKGTVGVPKPLGFLNPSDPYEGPSDGALNGILTGVGALIGVPLPLITDQGFVDNTVLGVTSTIEYSPGDYTLTIIPAYRKTEINDFHFGAGFIVTDEVNSETKSLEVRLASDNDSPLQWLIGGYYFNEATPYALFFDQGVAAATNNPKTLDTESTSAFGQATYAVTPSLRFTAGVRYSSEDKSQTGVVDYIAPFPTVETIDGSVSFTSTTWKLGVDYDLTPTSLLYANVGTGFKAGGFFNAAAPNNTFQPEKLTAYTVGSKNRFFNNTLQLNLEAFYWEYENKQVSHLAPVSAFALNLVTDNAGAATIYGLDLDALWAPTSNDEFSLSLQYDKSEYDEFQYAFPNIGAPPAVGCAVTAPSAFSYNVDCAGQPVSFSPEWIINFGYNHTFDLPGGSTLVGAVSTRYESESYVGDEFLPGQLQKSNMVSNASVTWNTPDRNLSITGYIDNIEDEAVAAGSFVQSVIGVPLVVLRPPQTYGVRLAAHF